MTHLTNLSTDVSAYFLNQLRDARTHALRDAEGFRDILFAIERLGLVLSGGEVNGNPGLGTYRPVLTELAREAPLFVDTDQLEAFHPTFEALYTAVKDARNDAMHQGAYARHLTHHSVQLAIILEDALMASLSKVTHFMVRAPVTAEPWHPVSFVRQQMLENSFSYLPIEIDIQGKPSWRLVSEQAVAPIYVPRPAEMSAKIGFSRRYRRPSPLTRIRSCSMKPSLLGQPTRSRRSCLS